MKWLFGIFILILACAISGVRFHPGNLGKYFERDRGEDYVEVLFSSGNRMAGRKIHETAQTLELGAGGGTAVFSKKEIASVLPLDPAQVRAGRYADVILREPANARPVLTLRYADSLFAPFEKGIERLFSRALQIFSTNPSHEAGPAELPVPPSGGAPAGASGLTSLLQTAKSDESGEDYAALIHKGLEQIKKSGN